MASFFEAHFQGARHLHYGRYLRPDRNRHLEPAWVTAASKGAKTVLSVDLAPTDRGNSLMRSHQEAWPKVLAHADERMTASFVCDQFRPHARCCLASGKVGIYPARNTRGGRVRGAYGL